MKGLATTESAAEKIPKLLDTGKELTHTGKLWLEKRFTEEINDYRNQLIEFRLMEALVDAGEKAEKAAKKDGVIQKEGGAMTILQSFLANALYVDESHGSKKIKMNLRGDVERALKSMVSELKSGDDPAQIAYNFSEWQEAKLRKEPLPEHSAAFVQSLKLATKGEGIISVRVARTAGTRVR